MLVIAGLVALGCSATPAGARQTKAPGRYVETITVGGTKREFVLRVPPAYDGTKALPVVVVLHGWTATGPLAEVYTKMGAKGDAAGFIGVYPTGLGSLHGWNAGFLNLSGVPNVDDVNFVAKALDQVESEVKVDLDREYVCGHSNGAMLALFVGSRLSGRLAAIASVAGTIGVPLEHGRKLIPPPENPISVLLIHGKKDIMVAYDPKDSAVLRGIGAVEGASWWVQQDGCNPSPVITKNGSGNVVTCSYPGGKGDSEVRLVTIENGTHDWPGGYTKDSSGKAVAETRSGISAADVIWDFFLSHPKRH